MLVVLSSGSRRAMRAWLRAEILARVTLSVPLVEVLVCHVHTPVGMVRLTLRVILVVE